MISSPTLRISLLFCIAVFSDNLLAGNVEITVTNIPNKQAPIKVEIFDKAGFDSDTLPPVVEAEEIPNGSTIVLTIPELPEGNYGFMVYQDLNDNGEMDFGFMGPKEPVAISGNAKIRLLSPPTWDSVKVSVAQAPVKVLLRMNH